MPVYFFQISNGNYAGIAENGVELADRAAAWDEMTEITPALTRRRGLPSAFHRLTSCTLQRA
jgi:hypothetical protein